jgi:hypothetical protein
MSRFHHRQKRTVKISIAFVVVAVLLSAIYLIKTIVARQMSGGFATKETTRHTELVEFTTSVKKASEKQKTERAKCSRFAGLEKTICETEAKAEEHRAKTEARIKFKKGNETDASAEAVAANLVSGAGSRSRLLR